MLNLFTEHRLVHVSPNKELFLLLRDLLFRANSVVLTKVLTFIRDLIESK